MIEADGDVVVFGSSFAGSLTALIAERIGLRPVLVEKRSHPRFALGESSTPVADMVLRDLALRYDLPRLLPLTKYGLWRRELPHVVCGRKRGFSFFKHLPGERFRTDSRHANELLVTASVDDERSDTHWLRSDVDAYFAAEVERNSIPHLDRTEVTAIVPERAGRRWRLTGSRDGEAVRIAGDFLIDSTGEAGLVGRALGLERTSLAFETDSRALYAHFEGLTAWRDMMTSAGFDTADHPFDCDAAAVHQILHGAWMWQLRFDNGVTSAGLVLDNRRAPPNPALSADEEWRHRLSRYPSLAEQFAQARIVGPSPGRLVRTGRLQRRWSACAGPASSMVPAPGGSVDALFSSGIAQSLCGIERLASILERDWRTDRLEGSLAEYERAVFSETAFVDELVGGSFRLLDRFDLFASFSMLYFAAATTYERRRAENSGRAGYRGQFLCADDAALRASVAAVSARARELAAAESDAGAADFAAAVALAIEPFNTAGLCDPRAANMYCYTAAPVE